MLKKSIQLVALLAIAMTIGLLVNSRPMSAGPKAAARLVVLALASAVLVAVLLLQRRRKRMSRQFLAGCCANCGYDLRGTPNRCTECGRQPPAGQDALKFIAAAHRESQTVHTVVCYLLAVALMLHPWFAPGIAKLAGYGYRAWVCLSCEGRFEAEHWRRYPPQVDEISVRVRMVDVLIANHLPAGMYRAEIEQLLGPAESSSSEPFLCRYPISLRSSSWGPTFTDYLILVFDDEGRLVNARRD